MGRLYISVFEVTVSTKLTGRIVEVLHDECGVAIGGGETGLLEAKILKRQLGKDYAEVFASVAGKHDPDSWNKLNADARELDAGVAGNETGMSGGHLPVHVASGAGATATRS